MLHHVFITLTTETFVAPIYVDAVAPAVAARFRLTFIIIWTIYYILIFIYKQGRHKTVPPMLSLTLTDVLLRVEVVAGVTVADVAARCVHTLTASTDVPTRFAFICLRLRIGKQGGQTVRSD